MRQGRLTLEQAQAQVLDPEVLSKIDDACINQMDDEIFAAGQAGDVARAIPEAALNCHVAAHKGTRPTQGNCHNTLAWLYMRQDQLAPAQRHYRQALDILKVLPHAEKVVGQIRYDLGEIQERQGNLAAAQAEYETLLEIARDTSKLQLEGDAQQGLGRVYLAQEDVEQARAAFERALQLSRQAHDRRGQETSLGNLGLVNHRLGRWQEAIALHRQALAISQAIGHDAGTGRHLGHLGSALLHTGQLRESERCLEQARAIACQRRDRYDQEQWCSNLGNLYQARAERAAQERGLTGGLKIGGLVRRIFKGKNPWLDRAEQQYRQALAIAREHNDLRGQAKHLTNLGNLSAQQGHHRRAEQHYQQALSLAEESGMTETQWRILYAWGQLCATQGHDRAALAHLAQAIVIVKGQRERLTVASRTRFWEEKVPLYQQATLCSLRLKKPWLALACTEQARARYLADLMVARAPSTRPPCADIDAVPQTSSAQDMKTEGAPPTALLVFNVTAEGTATFIVAHPTAPAGAPDTAWTRSPDGHVQARLMKSYAKKDLIHTLVQVNQAGQVVGGYLYEYERYVNELSDDAANTQIAQARWEACLATVGAELYAKLLAPVHQALARLSVKRVILMPNLGLSLLPLHAAYASVEGRRDYLLDHYEIAYAPSFAALYRCQTRAQAAVAQRTLLAIADPSGDLSWAGTEVERVARFFAPSQVQKLGAGSADPATTARVMAAAPDHTFLHLACHGKFNPGAPLRSLLQLTPPDVLRLETLLEQFKLPHTRLAVLSACESGMVDAGDLADEHLNLPTGLLLAGAPGVVSSLWVVNDLSTSLLMDRFYQYLIEEGQEPITALRRAQIWLRDLTLADLARYNASLLSQDPLLYLKLEQARRESLARHNEDQDARPFASPHHWAAFTLTGL